MCAEDSVQYSGWSCHVCRGLWGHCALQCLILPCGPKPAWTLCTTVHLMWTEAFGGTVMGSISAGKSG
ncbi:hypothetical protein GDO78_021537 [Eleutherodactylus coqui]|uniref:Uncharacterized protein n=1 Tax=Eleutherodactylus coqui TaxID=57060 RepID=A0A8J6EC93_ELECQ|nr:hypothetical protein GDO78_021537 [Eleutherodactylus coqui]